MREYYKDILEPRDCLRMITHDGAPEYDDIFPPHVQLRTIAGERFCDVHLNREQVLHLIGKLEQWAQKTPLESSGT